MKYDLEERTAKFGENIIDFCKSVPKNQITKSLLDQLIRSGTSIGANYMEAIDGSSKKDFRNKIRICGKESRETKHWLRMISKAEGSTKDAGRVLWQEAHELNLIFRKITQSCDEKK